MTPDEALEAHLVMSNAFDAAALSLVSATATINAMQEPEKVEIIGREAVQKPEYPLNSVTYIMRHIQATRHDGTVENFVLKLTRI